MENIVFAGCSYTWGQSLWYHGNFENDNHPRDGMFYSDMICPECMNYMVENRFANQVSKHFGKEARVKATNGGSNTDVLQFCKEAMDSQTELVIIQTTHFTRDNLLKITEQIENFENFTKETELLGIPVRFIHWLFDCVEDYEIDIIKQSHTGLYKTIIENRLNSKIIKDRTILLDGDFNFFKWTELGIAIKQYDSKKYSDVKNRTIVGYFGQPKEAKYRDTHLSLHGHNMVAKSIIDYIEQNKLLKND